MEMATCAILDAHDDLLSARGYFRGTAIMKTIHRDERGWFIWCGKQKQRVKYVKYVGKSNKAVEIVKEKKDNER